MGLGLTATTVYDQNSEKYFKLFSPEKHAESIKNNAFPCVSRQSPLKVEGKSPWLQSGSLSPVINNGELADVIERCDKLSSEEVGFYSKQDGIIELNKEGIDLALDRRVALFFQQAILCYKMSSFTFSAKGADDQIGTSPALILSSADGQKSTKHKREAAHSSTIPTLIAHAKDGSTPNGFVYLKGGSSHFQHNATVGMHECVNGADELIDGKGNDGKLRATAVKILNKVADGLDPIKATEEFLGSFAKQVALTKKGLKQTDLRKAVLDIYEKKIDEIKLASKEKEFYDRQIGVIINPNDPHEKILREVAYRKRFDVIRLQEVVESRIAKRVDTAKESMESREKSFLEHILVKEFAETGQRKVLEKLFAKTAAIFEEEYGKKQDGSEWMNGKEKKALKAFKTRVNNLSTKYAVPIDNLKRDLRADFRELSSAEFAYRAGVFRDLRTKVNRWTQLEFCTEYLKTVGQKISRSWVSRMEQLARVNTKAPSDYKTPLNQRRKFITREDAMNCAKTFGVDAGIFLPCLFTSA